MLPVAQRLIMKKVIEKKKNVFVATNLLESMLLNISPTRGEINDVFNILELGASGLVLAAETAIGKNPSECVNYLTKLIKTFKKHGKKYVIEIDKVTKQFKNVFAVKDIS